MDTERPKARLCLKLGQRKLSFQQQKPQATSKAQEVSSTTTTHTESTPLTNNNGTSNTSLTNESASAAGSSADSVEIPPLSGLCNLGNTCYVNALLQTLRFCPQFSEWIGELHSLCERLASKQPSIASGKGSKTHSQQGGEGGDPLSCNGVLAGDGEGSEEMEWREQGHEKEEETQSIRLATHLHNLWQRMSQKERTLVKPTNKVTVLSATKPEGFIAKLKEENPLFDNKLQQDAQEMLRYTLTSLQETLVTATKSTSSLRSLESDRDKLETDDIIDVERYCLKNSHKHVPGTRKRKFPFAESPAAGNRKASKVIKLNKNVTCKSKKVTEFFKPKDQSRDSKQEEISTKKINVKACSSVRDFITDFFQGQVAYQMRCYECDSYTRRTEPFLDVSVPVTSSVDILPGFPVEASPYKAAPAGSTLLSSTDVVGPHSLSWALSQFALREKLRGNNKYFCDECGHFVEAERSVLFSHLSSVMTIHLNRFTTQTWGLSSTVVVNKVGGNLAIPLSLSFKPWCTSDCNGKDRVYQLFAVVFHSGSSCNSGHYTACVRGKECKKLAPKEAQERFDDCGWVYFDDDQLDFISQSELLEMMSSLSNSASSVYILFYTCNL